MVNIFEPLRRGMIYIVLSLLIVIIMQSISYVLRKKGGSGKEQEQELHKKKEGNPNTGTEKPGKVSGDRFLFYFPPSQDQISTLEKSLLTREEKTEWEEEAESLTEEETEWEEDWRTEKGLALLAARRDLAPALLTVAAGILARVIVPNFFGFYNRQNMMLTISYLFLAGVPVACLLMLGDMDFSAGAIVNLGIMVYVFAVRVERLPVFLSIGIVFLTGAACGMVKAFLVVKKDCPPVITTLGLLYVFYGCGQLLMSCGMNQASIPYGFLTRQSGSLLLKPWMVCVAAAVGGALVYGLMRGTDFGGPVGKGDGQGKDAEKRKEERDRARMAGYVLASVMAALCGVCIDNCGFGELSFMAGMYRAEAAVIGSMILISGMMIGGTFVRGQRGTLAGCLLGCIFMTFILDGIRILENDLGITVRDGVMGILFVAVLLADQYCRRKRNGSTT